MNSVVSKFLLIFIFTIIINNDSYYVNGQQQIPNLNFNQQQQQLVNFRRNNFNQYQNEDTINQQHHLISYPESVEENSNYHAINVNSNNNYDDSFYQRSKKHNNNNFNNKNNVIPLDLLERMNSVGNISQFFDEFIAQESVDPRDIAVSRFGDDHVERSVAKTPKPAGCLPESAVVPLEPLNPSNDPTVIYFPSCTRVNRCSGCCSSPLLSCQPTKSEILTFSIIKSQFTGGNKMAYRGKEAVLVDQHLECKCDCKVKETDCNAYQVYEATQCQCICANFDEQTKCFTEPQKIWDSKKCTCRCKFEGNCTTGSYFDEHQCRCLPIPGTYRSEISPPPFFDRRKFILKAIPVDPTNNTRYDSGY